jgi:putative ABC transport system ATP-binding protein
MAQPARDLGAPPVVEAEAVSKVYRLDGVEVRALDGVDLVVERGDSMAIMGPSGSGKSTLLGLLAAVRNRVVGFVFQSFQLLARTPAVGNVGLPLVYRGLGRSERRRLATEALQSVGLGHRLQHRPSQLSGGEQQRVAIARALVTEPAMLLADEPTGNLDSRSGDEVLDLLSRLHAERGVAVVVVTHDPGVAARFRRRVVLHDGRLASETEPAR